MKCLQGLHVRLYNRPRFAAEFLLQQFAPEAFIIPEFRIRTLFEIRREKESDQCSIERKLILGNIAICRLQSDEGPCEANCLLSNQPANSQGRASEVLLLLLDPQQAPMAHVELVKKLYGMFAKQDVAGILAELDENIVWHSNFADNVALAGTYRGKAQVLEFFKKIPLTLKITHFEPKEFHAGHDLVVVYGVESGTVPNGKVATNARWVQLWHFAHGKPVRFEEFHDGQVQELNH